MHVLQWNIVYIEVLQFLISPPFFFFFLIFLLLLSFLFTCLVANKYGGAVRTCLESSLNHSLYERNLDQRISIIV